MRNSTTNQQMSAGAQPGTPVIPQSQNSQTDLNGPDGNVPDVTALESAWRAAHNGVLQAYIELVKSQGGLIPEMVAGSTLADVQSSAQVAQSAYRRIAAELARPAENDAPVVQTQANSAPMPTANLPFKMGSGGGSRSSGLGQGMEQQQGKRPDPTALVMQYYSSGSPRR